MKLLFYRRKKPLSEYTPSIRSLISLAIVFTMNLGSHSRATVTGVERHRSDFVESCQ